MSLSTSAQVIADADQRWDSAYRELSQLLEGKRGLACLIELQSARNDSEGARLGFLMELRDAGVGRRRAYRIAREA